MKPYLAPGPAGLCIYLSEKQLHLALPGILMPMGYKMKQNKTKLWNRNNLKNPHRIADKKQRVQAMFSEIADSYDLLNHLLSLNMDRRWRRRAVEIAQVEAGQSVLDLCCGTGDLTIEFLQRQPKLKEIVGIDFTEDMLKIALVKARVTFNSRKPFINEAPGSSNDASISEQQYSKANNSHKNLKINWLCADAERLPLQNEQYDCVSCAFGIRNLRDPQAGLREAYRLLKPGGKLLILEFTLPDNRWLSLLYQCYFRLALPLLAGMITQDKSGAYHYLPDSVRSFQTNWKLDMLIFQAGFTKIHIEKICWGTVLIYKACKPVSE